MIAAIALLLALAQQPVFRTEVDLMTVPCVVTTADGVPVRDLARDEFRLYENDRPRELRGFWLDSELPLEVGLIADISESQHGFWGEHEHTVDRFLASLIHTGDRGFVVSVNEKVMLRTEVKGGGHGLLYGFLPVRGAPLGVGCGTHRGVPLCGGTALWNAVYAAARLKLAGSAGSKALVILSDGEDTGSAHTIDEALAEVHRAGATVYAIRYPDADGESDLKDGLSRLATETGGLTFDSHDADYDAILARIQQDLRSHYVLGFRPGEAPEHRVRVEVTRPGLQVRCTR